MLDLSAKLYENTQRLQLNIFKYIIEKCRINFNCVV